MGCCGRGTSPLGGSSPPRQSVTSHTRVAAQAQPVHYSHIFFEYVGPTAMTVVGGGTGKRYRFDRPGARVAVEPQDKPSLIGVPHLRMTYAP